MSVQLATWGMLCVCFFGGGYETVRRKGKEKRRTLINYVRCQVKSNISCPLFKLGMPCRVRVLLYHRGHGTHAAGPVSSPCMDVINGNESGCVIGEIPEFPNGKHGNTVQ